MQAWCDSQHAGLVAQLCEVDSFPEQAVAKASKQSLGQAAKTTERSKTLDATPNLADALDDGAINAEHVDAVTRASKKLDGTRRAELITRADRLVDVARAGTVDEFARRLDLEAKKLREGDGIDRLERQRRNARARSWVDVEGMWNLSVTFDPLTGVKIASRIDAMVKALFGDKVPAGCPTDPLEKHRHIAAQAVTQLMLDHAIAITNHDHDHHNSDGDPTGDASAAGIPQPTSLRSSRTGPPEFVAVIDADAPGHHGAGAEFSIAVDIPASVLATLAGTADIHAVVVRRLTCHGPGSRNRAVAGR